MKRDINSSLNFAVFFLVACAFGLFLPLILMPIINGAGNSEIFEEAAKAIVILVLVLKIPNFKHQIAAVLAFSFLFGISESFFYLNNIFQIGDFSIFWQRFLTTVPMHMATALIIFIFAKAKKELVVAGFAAALILHIAFNLFILSI